MKRRFFWGLLVAMTLVNGCATSSELIKKSSVSTRNDVFQEMSDGGTIPQGYADLRIISSLKTHKPGIYPFETKSHGTTDYALLLNIDGQAVQINGSIVEENIEPRSFRDPEAGEGIRYKFRKNMRLKAGPHKVIVAIPEEEIAVEREISLTEGSSNGLVLEPIYGSVRGNQRPGFYGVTSYNEGIKGFRVLLNGSNL